MTTAAGVDPKIESYLARVRVALRGLPEREIEDILRELRSHAVELAGDEKAGVEAALLSLGNPIDLARSYRSENQMVRAECSASPLEIVQGLRHASKSGLGRVTATAFYAFGYISVLSLWAAAIDKLFDHSHTGLWYTPGRIWSLTLVASGSQPEGARELLGWWLVPIALLAGWGVRYMTDRIARWWIRRYRRLRQTQEA